MTKEKEIKLIEKTIKKLDYPTPEELFKSVEGKINQKEFESILGFLLINHYILIDRGEIVWTYGGKVVDEILSDKEKWITV